MVIVFVSITVFLVCLRLRLLQRFQRLWELHDLSPANTPRCISFGAAACSRRATMTRVNSEQTRLCRGTRTLVRHRASFLCLVGLHPTCSLSRRAATLCHHLPNVIAKDRESFVNANFSSQYRSLVLVQENVSGVNSLAGCWLQPREGDVGRAREPQTASSGPSTLRRMSSV